MSVKTRSSEEIKKDIVDQLFWDSRVDAANIQVDVSGENVTLNGKAPSYSAKLAAQTDTMLTPGVDAVYNNLKIEYPQNIKLPVDKEIQKNLINALLWNPNIDSSNIKVSVDKGVVTLEGSVETYWQKILVEELVFDMAGVLGIKNKIAVIPTESIIDESVANAIFAALDRNSNIEPDSVNVKVEDGVVTLSGTVSNWSAYNEALDAARHTVGVVNVINNLHVE